MTRKKVTSIWQHRDLPAKEKVESLRQVLNTSKLSTTLLLQRGIDNFEKAKDFFLPTWDQLHDPQLMKGMDIAVKRIANGLAHNEKIGIYGDYDVDGTTSVAMLYEALQSVASKLVYYVPDRKEGYGLSMQGVEYMASQGVSLLICIDCGTKAIDAAQRAEQKGIDLIICDHHIPGEKLPKAVAILNPQQVDCHYPYPFLSACAVGFKLMQALVAKGILSKQILDPALDLVVLSIAADIVPMTGENRIFAALGLHRWSRRLRPGLEALRQATQISKKPSISDLVFFIAPRINAAGRIAHAHEAIALLLAQESQEAALYAKRLEHYNQLRKSHEQKVTSEAIEGFYSRAPSPAAIIEYNASWHKGVLGIAASRCVEQIYLPTILFTKQGDLATGSGRSIVGYNIYEAIRRCSKLLIRYGGHAYAVGLTLAWKDCDRFAQQFSIDVQKNIDPNILSPTISIDAEISLNALTLSFCQLLQRMAPFGPGFSTPLFSSRFIEVIEVKTYQDLHLKLTIRQFGETKKWTALGFCMADKWEKGDNTKPLAIVYKVVKDYYRGEFKFVLHLKDFRFMTPSTD